MESDSHLDSNYPKQSKKLNRVGLPRIILVSNRVLLPEKNKKRSKLGEEISPELQLAEVFNSKTLNSELETITNNVDDKEKKSFKREINRYYQSLKNSRYVKAVKKIDNFEVDIIETENHQQYLSEVVDEQGANGLSWLFWIHGNNQTLEASLETCFAFQKTFPVNIVLFAWPSRSYNPKSLAHLLFSAITMVHPATRILSRMSLIKAVYERYRQYRVAKKLAIKTTQQLTDAYQLLVDHLFSRLEKKSVSCNLLVHSLGHYLLAQTFVSEEKYPGFQFDNGLFHQGDIEFNEGAEWISSCKLVKQKYITINRNDYALYFSGLCNNRFKYSQARTRLGNSSLMSSDHCTIIDFTNAKGIGVSHDILWSNTLELDYLRTLNNIFVC